MANTQSRDRAEGTVWSEGQVTRIPVLNFFQVSPGHIPDGCVFVNGVK